MRKFCDEMMVSLCWMIGCWTILKLLATSAAGSYEDTSLCDERDRRTLLNFKSAFVDPDSTFATWQEGKDCCQWSSVTCNSQGRVQELRVEGVPLSSIPNSPPTFPVRNESYPYTAGGSLGDLTSLQRLFLVDIYFDAAVPYSWISLSLLEELVLIRNNFTGEIPRGLLGSLYSLRELTISDMHGEDGTLSMRELCKLVNLTAVTLVSNSLNQTIPKCFGNLRGLTQLTLVRNALTGPIPNEIGGLVNLEYLDATENELTGSLPSSLGGLQKLQYMILTRNHFSGRVPAELGDLKYLRALDLSDNLLLDGEIPKSLGQLSFLTSVVLKNNNFSGGIPCELGGLADLELLELQQNSLNGSIPSELGLIYGLNLHLNENNLTGAIPESLRFLNQFNVADNSLTGSIPVALLQAHTVILYANQLSIANIPDSVLPRNPRITYLDLGYNRFAGPIPYWLSRLQHLELLDASRNSFTGKIPMFLLSYPFIQFLDLSHNLLESNLHDMSCGSPLIILNLSYNHLNESIPDSLFENSQLQQNTIFLDFSHNQFTLSIPASIGSLTYLSYLDLSYNNFSGQVPPSIYELPNLTYFDFSNNNNLTH